MQTKTLIVPARNGWQWIAEGSRIYGKNRMLLALAVIGFWLLIGLVGSQVPQIGRLLATICMPAISVGLMGLCRYLDQEDTMAPSALLSGLSGHMGALLLLGVMYIVVLAAALGVVALIDGGRFFHVFLMGGKLDAAEANPLATWAFLLLMLPVAMAYWYAPILVAWHGHSVGKSLFFSLFACLRNWRAFVIYTCSLIMLMILMTIVAGMMASWLPASLPRAAQSIPAILLFFFLAMPVLYASFYVSYRDVFVAGGDQG